MSKWHNGYGRISSPTEDTDESVDETKDFLLGPSFPRIKDSKNRPIFILTAINIIILVIALILFSIGFHNDYHGRNPKLRQVHSYTPVMDRLNLPITTQLMNGTFFTPKYPSVGRQLPNPDAEAVWSEWDEARVFPVTKAEIIAMGKDPETAVQLVDEHFRLGDDAYAAYFDVFHHLHCLNSLRKIIYGDYYNQTMGDAHHPEGMRELHINHCIDILVQAVQCSGNLNLITLHWVETKEAPWPDMSINRKCIAFDQLTEFRLKNTVNSQHYAQVVKKPKGAKEIRAPDALWKFLGKENPHQDHDKDFVL